MLEHTFVHIQGVGVKTERRLWKRGILTWQDLLDRRTPVFPGVRESFIRGEVQESLNNRDDLLFFGQRLTSEHIWRLYEPFKSRAVFLDIETSGNYHGIDEITVIGLYDGCNVRSFVSGHNLNDFEAALDCYDLVVTFNGGSFDLPYIRRCFPNISLPPVHIDLRFLMSRLGYKGGLKVIEKRLGISREGQIDGMNGYDAVMLWQAYLWGDDSALELLIRYNTADIVNLKPLMEWGYRSMKQRLLGCGQGGLLEV